MGGQAEVQDLIAEGMDLDPIDRAHLASPCAACHSLARIEHHRSTG
jgi:hypothetical protein